MTIVEQLADDITKAIADKYLYFSNPQKADIKSMIVRKFSAHVPEPQERLCFTDADTKKNTDQCEEILALLKKRRSEGATNVELADKALKYTSRVSELRRKPYYYQITCTREAGRVTRYRLHPASW